MPGIDYDKIRTLVGIKKVLDLIGFKAAETRGDQLRGQCPIHGFNSPKSRSFSVSLRKNAFHCFECGAHGNQLELWAAVKKLALYDAAHDLCQQAGIEVPLIRRW